MRKSKVYNNYLHVMQGIIQSNQSIKSSFIQTTFDTNAEGFTRA